MTEIFEIGYGLSQIKSGQLFDNFTNFYLPFRFNNYRNGLYIYLIFIKGGGIIAEEPAISFMLFGDLFQQPRHND